VHSPEQGVLVPALDAPLEGGLHLVGHGLSRPVRVDGPQVIFVQRSLITNLGGDKNMLAVLPEQR
jgi:hypothetical protein